MSNRLKPPYVPDVLVVRDGFIAGSRRYEGGHTLLAYPEVDGPLWNSYHSDEAIILPPEGRFPYRSLGIKIGGQQYLALAVIERTGFDLVESRHIPFPFDRHREGGARLPEIPE